MALPLPIAARFITDQSLGDTLSRFFAALVNGQVTTEDLVVWAAILLGVTCGLLGCFIVLRRQSLLGDAIGHAVLPGVCLGFLVAGARSTLSVLRETAAVVPSCSSSFMSRRPSRARSSTLPVFWSVDGGEAGDSSVGAFPPVLSCASARPEASASIPRTSPPPNTSGFLCRA